MAKGDYTLVTDTPFQSVSSHPRRYGVMFNPASSRSRLHIVDSGRRYGVRLNDDGTVQYSIDGDVSWNDIHPLPDPCTRRTLPAFLSFDETRAGQDLGTVRFDMIAVGRGRVIAKEAGTDRIYHLVLDELFRTRHLTGEGCDIDVNASRRTEDPPVPGFYMKLDPEFFATDPPSLVVPPEAKRSYARHPASLRLPAFSLVLEQGVSDVMLVMQHARTWYRIDDRSPQSIAGPEDLQFSEDDFKAVFTEAVIHDILEAAELGFEAQILAALKPWFEAEVQGLLEGVGLNDLRARFSALGPVGDLLANLISEVSHWLADDVGPWLVLQIVAAIPRALVDSLAQSFGQGVQEDGYGALAFPAYVALGVLLYGAHASKAFSRDDDGVFKIDPGLLAGSLPENRPLSDAIARLMLISRRRAFGPVPPDWPDWMPTANQPPAWAPVYLHSHFVPRVSGSVPAAVLQSAATPLPDGRLELWTVDAAGGVASTWKTSTDATARWAPWEDFLAEVGALPAAARQVAVAPLPDGRLELWAVDAAGGVSTTWKLTTQPNANWAPWGDFLAEVGALPVGARQVAAARLPDGRLELWAVDAAGGVSTTWKLTTQPNASWAPWSDFLAEVGALPSGARQVAVAALPDARLELWAVDEAGGLFTTWKLTTAPNASWAPWEDFQAEVGALPAAAQQAAVTRLPDGRLELWAVDAEDGLSTTWKLTTQPNASWAPWEDFLGEVGAIAAGVKDVAVAPLADGRLELWAADGDGSLLSTHKATTRPNAGWTPWSTLVRHGSDGLEQRFGIQFSKVLDLGVGYSHWSEQWLHHFGGEIHSLLATRPLFQQERYNLTQYRFLNGPVIDGDAFNDGTTNFYLFVKLGPPGSDGAGLRQRYAILWMDEQAYFTQRWRLLHPTEDVLGDLFSLSHALHDHPEWFHFSPDKYWSPFLDDRLSDDSRMAVRRQIVALTGFDPAAGRHEIYTICYNYGVSDHTWRWRLFPAGEPVVIDAATAQDLDPRFPGVMTTGPAAAYVAVNTLDLRDDTTLHVRGTRRSSATAPLRPGRWVQRYLPADCRHVPAPHQLTGGKPAAGFDHPWDFVSETAYRRADQFYQFGVYEPRVDSRCQYYEVELLPGADGVLPRVEDVTGAVWCNGADVAGGDRLLINTTNFTWSIAKDTEGKIPVSSGLLEDRRDLPTMSMYEETTRFRLLERKPLGLIAVFYDKRDDELQPATDLPHATVFREDFVEASIPPAWEDETGGEAAAPPPPPSPPRNVRLLVKSNRRVLRPPVVRKARVVRDKAPGLRTLHVSFWTPQTEQEVCENLWKVSLAAIDDTGVAVPIFSLTRFPNFVRRAVPDAPLPYGFTGDLGDAWRYDCDWKYPKEMSAVIDRFCTPDGHVDHATSLWFEDVVGHRAIAQEIVFA
jgi:hypothetical protein